MANPWPMKFRSATYGSEGLSFQKEKVMKSLRGKPSFTLLFVLLFLTLTSCKKELSHLSNAAIIGFDRRECVCCGGLEIMIDNVTPPFGVSYFLVSEMPPSYKIDQNANFPIPVSIDYTIDTAACFGNFIRISRIVNR